MSNSIVWILSSWIWRFIYKYVKPVLSWLVLWLALMPLLILESDLKKSKTYLEVEIGSLTILLYMLLGLFHLEMWGRGERKSIQNVLIGGVMIIKNALIGGVQF